MYGSNVPRSSIPKILLESPLLQLETLLCSATLTHIYVTVLHYQSYSELPNICYKYTFYMLSQTFTYGLISHLYAVHPHPFGNTI